VRGRRKQKAEIGLERQKDAGKKISETFFNRFGILDQSLPYVGCYIFRLDSRSNGSTIQRFTSSSLPT